MAIGFGMVGCGMIAKFHARAIKDIREAKLVACFDTVPQAAERQAAETGCRFYHRLDEMLADPEVDVVTICTPSGAHLEPARGGGAGGKARDRGKAAGDHARPLRPHHRRMRKEQRVLSTIFPSRFHESAQLLKKAVDQGRFGRLDDGRCLRQVVSARRQYYDSGAGAARGSWTAAGP